jgi:hypothetical protein
MRGIVLRKMALAIAASSEDLKHASSVEDIYVQE